MTYTLSTTTDASFDETIDTITTELEAEGFGILTDIDVQETLQKKLDIETDRYRILGACNPPLAHEGLETEPNLGALLPCNVVVYETDEGEVVVSAVDPRVLVGITENPALDSVATEVSERFERVLDEVSEQLATETDQ
ncbi:DUF302 domain-containing protein [Halorhabdus rudnickae]|uniref:DUF302 domain-containing protein n=1 Tax=Halorhabdus rudnickae TaxID=1775544 RepID=UPI0010840F3C|nr:DUF302 domain-containing protein [Halorhabdus rudnickae]